MTPLNVIAESINPDLHSLPFIEAEYSAAISKPSEVSLLSAQQYFDSCNDELITNSKHHDFLEEKGINGQAIRELFIGFAARVLHKQIPHKDSAEGVYYRHTLKELALLTPLGREVARGSFTYPLYTPSGSLNGAFIDRKQCPKSKEPTKRIVWDKDKPAIFNYRALGYFDKVIVTSYPPEAARLWSMGYRNVIAIVSEDCSLEELIRLFKQLRLAKVILHCSADKFFGQKVRRALKATHILCEDFIDAA